MEPTTQPGRIERRFIPSADVELRMEGDDQRLLKGYGAVFGKRSENLGYFEEWYEEIEPGAFDKALKNSDVRGLFNHEPNMILGREAAGTLRLAIDERGLAYEIDVPDTTAGRDLVVSVMRKDITGSSFSFTMPQDGTGQRWERKNGKLVRVISEIEEVFDLGPVTFPAYSATKVSARSIELAHSQLIALPSYKRLRQRVDVEMAH